MVGDALGTLDGLEGERLGVLERAGGLAVGHRRRVPRSAALALLVSATATSLWLGLGQSLPGPDPAAAASFWQPAVSFLQSHLTPTYRVEAVDTTHHWEAYYLPRAGIPLARGWYRENGFPQNARLYGRLGPEAYLLWLRRLGVRYIVLANVAPDYSAIAETELLRSGRLRLETVFISKTLTILAVPNPRSIVTGPGKARVTGLTESGLTVDLSKRGIYRIAIRWSPYWGVSAGCVSSGKDSMIRLLADKPGLIKLTFRVNADQVLARMSGARQPVWNCSTGYSASVMLR